ncbi:TOMM precursor leader peptide-binding protein [Actinomyces ruminicola]|uniref:TOMM precursor leader peptide-binding protein n=1 Tax=Actinomyces ruminicola TaxID=332524 RepID=UPI0011CC96F2|nr:TOMM precursor leader peptide-binding protein [Actinomyces ruminicola]
MLITLPDETLVIYAGEFGRRVVDLLDTSHARLHDATGPVYTASLPYASRIISVWSGHRPEDRDRIDSVAFARAVPAVGVELLPTSLECGPVVVPGRTACYGCYRRRLQQHQERTVSLMRAGAKLPAGFSGGEVAIAVGFIGQALSDMERRDAGTALGGEVRVFDLIRGDLHKYETVAVDRCERCGSRYDRFRHPTGAIAGLV